MDKSLLTFFGLILVSLGLTYYTSGVVASIFYIILLIAYFRSEDEGFWLAFFFVLSDGFMGFFGNYEAVLTVIPGLPSIEVGQFYILLTLIKTYRVNENNRPFYTNLALVVLAYIGFLVVQGYFMGLSSALNVQFRVVKYILPLFLFYSIPRLMDREEDYLNCLKYLFPITFFALFAQVFTLTMGVTPTVFAGVTQVFETDIFQVREGFTYRGIFNDKIILITFFGAFYCLALPTKPFSPAYLYLVILAGFIAIFLSATRGWVLAFSFFAFSFMLLISNFSFKRTLAIAALGLVLIVGILSVPIVRTQVDNAFTRMLTLGALAQGDITAGGTLVRLEERSPKVMKVWRESPLTGWGYSNTFFKKNDIHVANQTILMHSGIVGLFLVLLFFGYFCGKLFFRSLSLPAQNPHKKALMVFVLFFLGWFVIHSTSGQHFGLYASPGKAISQAIFFAFGATIFRKTFLEETASKINGNSSAE